VAAVAGLARLVQLELHLQMVLGVQVVLALRQAFQAHLLHTLVVVVALRMVLERRVLAVQEAGVIAEQAQAQLVYLELQIVVVVAVLVAMSMLVQVALVAQA
jgi:hypothetical protein